MTRRLATAYARPTHALEHLHIVAAGLRVSVAQMPDQPVRFQGHVLSAGDLLATWAVELVVHHHDLDVPDAALSPEAVLLGRRTAEALLGVRAETRDDVAVLLDAFGRA
ncbi:hypothetical protein [Nigerium massiliense]|uniref:hypothetical protein n=1 Tax=Nigerium massiliense TaxID=1522317 RepID=UPI0006935C07|nr:hypothetical protein [Nigerium massiliense]